MHHFQHWRTSVLFWGIFTAILILIPTSAIYADVTALADDTEPETILQIIQYGGPIGYLIILLSVGGAALVIEAFVTIRREKLSPPEVIGELESLLENQDYERALALCQSNESFIAKVVGAGLSRLSFGPEVMQESMGAIGEEESTRVYQKIGWINLIANMSPLLGLLGTVTGMMIAFRTISNSPSVVPSELAGGIFQALVTTVLGLIVAIPYSAVYFYLKNKTDKMITEIGIISSELMDRFKIEST